MGLRDNKRRRNIFQWLKTQNFDTIFSQETHIHQKNEIDIINNEWHGKHYWAYGSYHSAGVRVLLLPKFPGMTDEPHMCSDYGGCTLYVPIKVEDSDIQLLNVYAPNAPSERRKFFDNLSKYISIYHGWRLELCCKYPFGQIWRRSRVGPFCPHLSSRTVDQQ